MNKKQLTALILFFWIIGTAILQANPLTTHWDHFIYNYNKHDYKASCQNWGSCVSKEGILFVGNNSGLLSFDGNSWQQYPLPAGNGVVNSVAFYQDTLFSGTLNDIGYWVEVENKLIYHSLITQAEGLHLKNEIFNTIYPTDSCLYFKSQGSVFKFKNGELSRIGYPPAFLAKSRVKSTLFLPNELYQSFATIPSPIIFATPFTESQWLIGTESQGLFLADHNGYKNWDIAINSNLKKEQITAFAQSGSTFCIGTAHNGAYIINSEGALIKHFNLDNRLQDNWVHHIKFQNSSKLWLSLDNGVSLVDLQSPIAVLAKRTDYGKLNRALLIDQTLWIETSLGIFKNREAEEHRICFERVSPSDEEIWNEQITTLYPTLPSHITDTLQPIRKIVCENKSVYWVLKEDNRIVRIRISGNKEAETVTTYTSSHGLPSQGIVDLAIIDAVFTVTTSKEVLRYDKISDRFYPYEQLNKSSEFLKTASYIFPTEESHYWVCRSNEIFLFMIRDQENQLVARINLSNYGLSLVNRDKRIIALSDSLLLVSAMEGIALINTHQLIRKNSNTGGSLHINSLSFIKNNERYSYSARKAKLPHDFSQIEFKIGTSVNSAIHTFSYQLQPLSDQWSDWQQEGTIRFWQLPAGEYTLLVRQYSVKGPFQEISIPFTIRPAWYYSNIVLIISLLLICVTIYTIVRNRFKQKELSILKGQQQQLVTEQHEKIRLQNEILNQELQNKNNELSLQTTALLKRNESMQSLLTELDSQKESLGDRYPQKMYARFRTLIEQNLSTPSDWLLFENYFNLAHQNFTERLRLQYPALTANDLQICCLLRMNLSTKEIAALQNITIRAIELRRYRLRKRLNLENDQNLIDFLSSF